MLSNLIAIAVSQIPTPTALPPLAPAPVILPDGFGLWDSTDEVIQTWNLYGNYTYGIQIGLLVAVIIAGIFIVTALVKWFGED